MLGTNYKHQMNNNMVGYEMSRAITRRKDIHLNKLLFL